MNEQDETFYSRERRKSRYLSYPYTNMGPGHKGVHVKTEDSETPRPSHQVQRPRVANNHSNRSSTTATKSSKKKLQSKWCRKHIRWSTMSSSQEFRNVSSSELLSGLYSNALDCNFLYESRKSDLVEWFFSAYRLSTFSDEAELATILENQKSGNMETPFRNGSLNVNSEQEKKKSEQTRKHRNKSLPIQSDMNKDVAASEFLSGCYAKINNTRPGESMEDVKPALLQQNVESTTREGSSRAKRSLAPKASRARKAKKMEVSLDDPRTKFFPNLLDDGEKCNKSSSFVIDLQMAPPSRSSIPEKNNCENKVAVDLTGSKPELHAFHLGTVGNLDNGFSPMNASQFGGVGNLDNGFFTMNAPAEHLMTKCATVIPDLNDSGFEDNSTEKKLEGDISFKQNQRMNQEPKSELSRSISSGTEIIQTINYNRLEVNGSCLLLQFDPGVSLPSKDNLLATFCRFGPLGVSETQLSKDGHAQIAFLESADAEEAFRNLKQNKQFGVTLVDHNDPSETFAPLKQCEKLAGSSGLKPLNCDRPSLDYIKQNLEMMASILEKKGHTISPQMRDALDAEIKDLMEKLRPVSALFYKRMATIPIAEENLEQTEVVEQEAVLEGQDMEGEAEDIEEEEKPTKRLTIVWDHFDKIPLDENNRDHKAKCKYCPARIAYNPVTHGTRGLQKHLNRCPQIPNRINKMSQVMFTAVGSSRIVGRHLYNQERYRRAIAKYIILDEMPFQTVESEGFRQMMSEVEPRFQIPSRSMVTRDCLKLYLEEAGNLKSYFKRTKVRVSLTTDTWTSNQNSNYMCLTAHWIDEDWHLQKRILNFCVVGDHNGDTIVEEIEKCLLSWGIDKIFTITVDNASSKDNALSTLKSVFKYWNDLVCDGDFLHLRCCAHIMNLIVSDGVKDMDDSIEAIRNAIKYVRSSLSRFRKFKELVEKMKIDSKSLLTMDCPTRWNSTLIMLENAIKFSSVFVRMEELDTEYQKSFKNKKLIGPPTLKSFKEVKEFVAFLKVFYNDTWKFSGYGTSNVAFHQIINVALLLKRRANNPNSLLCHLAKSMQGKYDKYWGKFENLNPLLVIAVVLDPRYKMKFLKFAFEDMFSDPTLRDTMSKKVSAVLYRLYDHYSDVLDASQSEIQSGSQSQSQSQVATKGCSGMDILNLESFDIDGEGSSAIQRFLAHTDIETQTDKYAELERYLQAELADYHNPTFDILDWWKVNASKYKVISLIACDVLAMPVSTMSSESTFNIGGLVINEFRSSLSSKMVEALICAQNWLSPLSTFKLKGLDIDNFNETLEAENDEEASSMGEVEELKR